MSMKKISIFILFLALLSACAPRVFAPNTHAYTTTTAPDGSYRVQKGDNLYRIGLRYGLSVDEMVKLNNLGNAHQIEVGQLLRVRSSGSLKKAQSSTVRPQKRKSTRKKTSTKARATSRDLKNLHLIWPNSGKVIAHYNGKNRKGVDITNKKGSPVLAAAAGEVAYVGEQVRGYGKLVLIRHSKNILTAYAHNHTILVTKGQKVRQGQKIATVGASGTKKAKLHFELRLNGKAVNPVPYLPAR